MSTLNKLPALLAAILLVGSVQAQTNRMSPDGKIIEQAPFALPSSDQVPGFGESAPDHPVETG